MKLFLAMTTEYAKAFDAAVDAKPAEGENWAEAGHIQLADLPHSGKRYFYQIEVGANDTDFALHWLDYLNKRFDMRKYGVDLRESTRRHFHLANYLRALQTGGGECGITLSASKSLQTICQKIFGDKFQLIGESVKALDNEKTSVPLARLKFNRSDKTRLGQFAQALQGMAATHDVDVTEPNLVRRFVWENFGDEVLNLYELACEVSGLTPQWAPGAEAMEAPVAEADTTAVYLLLDEIFSDQVISSRDLARIHAAIFDESRPFMQPTDVYKIIREHYQKHVEDLKKSNLPQSDLAGNKITADTLALLFGDYPGSLERYREQLVRAGLPEPILLYDLPQVQINSAYESPNNPNILILDVDVGGVNSIYEINLSSGKAFSESIQPYLTGSAASAALNDAIIQLLRNSQEGILDESLLRVCDLLGNIIGPYPNLAVSQAQQINNENDKSGEALVVSASEGFDEESYSDLSPVDGGKEILGNELMSWLEETGLRARVGDSDGNIENHQMSHQDDPHPRRIEGFSAASYNARFHGLTMLSRSSGKRSQEYFEVHELAHAINFAVQAEQAVWSDVVSLKMNHDLKVERESWPVLQGPQGQIFAARMIDFAYGGGTLIPFYRFFDPPFADVLASAQQIPSGYAFSNHREWFAELMTHYLLERAGRLDILQNRTDHHPEGTDSLFAVDPLMYLIIDKIVTTLENREEDPASYQRLMQGGIDDALVDAALAHLKNYGIEDGKSLVTGETEGYAQIDEGAGLEDWRELPLAEMTMTGDWQDQVAFRQDQLERHLQSGIKRRPGLNENGHYIPDVLLATADYQAMEIIFHLQWDGMTADEVMRYLIENGLRCREDLEILYVNLAFLTREDLESHLPEPIFMDEVWKYYQEEIRKTNAGE